MLRTLRLAPAAALAAFLAALAAAALAAPSQRDPREELRPEDQARADAIGLKRSDLQGTWRAARIGGGSASPRGLACPQPPDLSDLVLTGSSLSPLFRSSRGVLVGAAVEVYATAAQARAAFDRSTARGAVVPCGGRFYPVVPQRGQRLRLTSARTAETVTYGDATIRYRFHWRVTLGRRWVRAYSDLYFAIEDRVVLVVGFFSDPRYVTAAFQQALVSTLEERI